MQLAACCPCPAIAVAGHHKTAAPCAGSLFTRLAPSLCCPDRPHCAEIPTHQSQAGRPTRHGCLMHQGLEQDVVQNPGCTNAATTSTKTHDQRPSLEHKGSLVGETLDVDVFGRD